MSAYPVIDIPALLRIEQPVAAWRMLAGAVGAGVAALALRDAAALATLERLRRLLPQVAGAHAGEATAIASLVLTREQWRRIEDASMTAARALPTADRDGGNLAAFSDELAAARADRTVTAFRVRVAARRAIRASRRAVPQVAQAAL